MASSFSWHVRALRGQADLAISSMPGLSPARRDRLRAELVEWALRCGVGHHGGAWRMVAKLAELTQWTEA